MVLKLHASLGVLLSSPRVPLKPSSLPSRPIPALPGHQGYQARSQILGPFPRQWRRQLHSLSAAATGAADIPEPEPFVSASSSPSPTRFDTGSSSSSSPTNEQQQRSPPSTTSSASLPSKTTATLAISVGVVMIAGTANRLLYKMALTPLGDYVFFLAQLQTFGYVAVYFGALLVRWKAGKVTPAMLSVPGKAVGTFVAIGFVEALSALLSFIGAANLPGVVLPLLSQTVMFWQVLLATVVLRKRLGWMQVGAVGLVVSGVVLAAWPGSSSSATAMLASIDPFYAGIFVFSMLFPALDTILKERVFRFAKEQVTGGKDLDLFVVNSFGSLAQAVFVFGLLPFITAARGMALQDLPAYLHSGWMCCRGLTPPCGGDCSGAPLIPLLYVIFNLLFNIAALRVIRQAGNVMISLVMSAIVPITLFAFTLPLPYLDPAPPLGPTFLAGAAVLMVGLAMYNAPMWLPALRAQVGVLREKSRGEWGDSSGGGGAAGMAAQ